jgi:predicted O-methyltransferase YrrM
VRQIIPESIGTYLQGLHGPVDPLLETIRAEGLAAGLPLVEPDTARLLRSLAIATAATNVLEIGTAIGYSAIWMAQTLPAHGRLISLEIDPARAATARANFERAGLSAIASVIVGDASRFLHKVAGPFDLIFQDGSKQLYEPLLDPLVDHLRPGGVLVTDNVLWDGEVVDGFAAAPRHPHVDTVAIRKYNTRLAADPRLLTTFLACGDGVAVSVKLSAT